MRLNLGVDNLDVFESEITALFDKFPTAIARVGNFVAQSTAQRARHKISTGTRSGRHYAQIGHTASAPGEPPASITGRLVNSITFSRMTDKPGTRATAGSDLAYARILEFGGYTKTSPEFGSRTVFIEPRPFLLPSFLEAVRAAEGKLKKEFEKL